MTSPAEAYATHAHQDSSIGNTPWFGFDVGHEIIFAEESVILDLDNGQTSYYLIFDHFEFDIPVGSRIDGFFIYIPMDGWGDLVSSSTRMVKDGVIQSTELSTGAVWYSYDAYGDGTTLLGSTWNVANINSDSFGVAISASANADDSGAAMYGMGVWVSYTEGAGESEGSTFNETTSGGIVAGSITGVQSRFFKFATGGVVTSGAASNSILGSSNTYNEVATGGVVLAGLNPVKLTASEIGSGGIVCAGISIVRLTTFKHATGGIVISGNVYFTDGGGGPSVPNCSARGSGTPAGKLAYAQIIDTEDDGTWNFSYAITNGKSMFGSIAPEV